MQQVLTAWRGFPQRHPVWTTTLGILLLLVLLLAFFNWNWARGPVARIVSASTGREFRIEGNLDVDYFPLAVHAERLYLGMPPGPMNPQWHRSSAWTCGYGSGPC